MRERQLQIMRSFALELDPHQPGGTGRGSGASVGSHSTGSASTGAASGSLGASSRRAGRRSRTDGAGQQARPRRSRSADVGDQIMRNAGMPVSTSASSSPSRRASRRSRSRDTANPASAMMGPRRRSADLTKEIEKSLNTLALDVLEKDVSERTAAEAAAASARKEPPPRCEYSLVCDG